jgi:integrase
MPRVADSPFECLEDDELDALLTKAASEPLWYAAVLVAVDAGLRQGELRALKWTDISTVTGKVTVQRSRWRNIDGPPKSGKPRSLSLTQRALKALHATRETKLRGPYVFSRAKDGGAFGAEYMNETIDRLTRTAGLNKSGWHTLRHTFCTRLAMKGVPPKTIQELAGHASLATTMRYMHVVKGAADAAIALLDGPGTEWARKAASGAEE